MGTEDQIYREYTKAMADVFKHLSTLSVALIIGIVALAERLFKSDSGMVFAYSAIFAFIICLITSIFANIAHTESILKISHLPKKELHKRVASPTGLAILSFVAGFILLFIYFVLGLASK